MSLAYLRRIAEGDLLKRGARYMKYDKAVVIGRFQPFHNGHVHMVKEALAVADTVYIVIGSANLYPDVRNPFTSDERKHMIQEWINISGLSRKDRKRVVLTSVNDYLYNEQKWKMEVRKAIQQEDSEQIVIVGAEKGKDSYWLTEFGWKTHYITLLKSDGNVISASDFRNQYLRSDFVNGLYRKSDNIVFPISTIEFMEEFRDSPTYERLREEQLKYDKELEKFKDYPYPEALNCCTADSVVICNNHLLVIKRKFSPGKYAYALPGGHKNADETFLQCAIRELTEEVKMKVPTKVIAGSIRNSFMFDHPHRSAYFSKPTVAQYIVIEPNQDGSLPKVRGADDALDARWMPLHKVQENQAQFFDDHYQIIVAFIGI
ncbi:hypothetical protein POP12_009 [Pectobacterium phage POP12]|nr:hypothetical protein POP12_009 [Pectobacterium phage POP12]